MNIKEWATRYDVSTINDIPATADHMSTMEGIHMWAYPEPDYGSWDDGTMMTLGVWYIETSITGSMRLHGDGIFMGQDSYHYIDTDVNE